MYPIANYKFGKNKPPKKAKDINLEVRAHIRLFAIAASDFPL